ncbi:MAG: divalent-cation tolerance protein CutA [Verrucomicrobiae bacterium]|nr:divalent-cation tolerance protein CutA [Verrucomicrobiae bacterium]NNJ44092.1 divalent-cation tolerance protein CutA [Akkermansiaceae bacterium]
MTEALVVLCAFPDAEKARQIGTHLVERQYAGCINIIPGVESIYQWRGELCQDREVMAVIKTTRQAFAVMSRELAALHPYDEPEIIAMPVVDGSAGYLAWLHDRARG